MREELVHVTDKRKKNADEKREAIAGERKTCKASREGAERKATSNYSSMNQDAKESSMMSSR